MNQKKAKRLRKLVRGIGGGEAEQKLATRLYSHAYGPAERAAIDKLIEQFEENRLTVAESPQAPFDEN